MKPLKGKVVVVTGASRGIGKATAFLLALRGADLVLVSRNSSSLGEVRDSLSSVAGNVVAIAADVRIEREVSKLASRTMEKFGRVDALINNAGVAVYSPLSQTSVREWDAVIDTNLKGVYLCTRYFLPLLLHARDGHLINVASQAGLYGMPNLVAYCASKFGVVGFSEALRKELMSSRVKVSYICPGYTETDMVNVFPEKIRRNSKKARPETVAEEIAKILVTGQAYPPPMNMRNRILRRLRNIWRI